MNRAVLLSAFVRFAIILAVLTAILLPARAMDIQEVRSPSGITAWLVEDYTVPIIALSMRFAGGSGLDPKGKEGAAVMTAAMMDEGAGDIDAASLKTEFEERAIGLGFTATNDSIDGYLEALVSEKDRAFELMAMILADPRFEANSLERIRAANIAAYERRLKNPRFIQTETMRSRLFPGHAYGRSARGTGESLARISRDDLIDRHRALFNKSDLIVGVVGAVSAAELAADLDRLFAALPANSQHGKIGNIEPQLGFREDIEFDSPQTSITITFPGLLRKDEDFFAAYLVTLILGGGSFTSRLYDEIREKRGLAYGVGATLRTLDHAAYISAGLSTRPDQAAEALELLLAEFAKMAQNGPTADELEAVRKYALGSYAVNNLDGSSNVADVLVELQASDLGSDYIETRRDDINAVTLEQAKAVARRLFSAGPAIVTIGPGGP